MALSASVYLQKDSLLNSSLFPSTPWIFRTTNRNFLASKKPRKFSISITCSSHKIVRYPVLDKHAEKQNRIRFVQKLKTLLLSKPKHYISLHILSKCRSYLCLPKPRSILSMIHRYPSIFEVFRIPLRPSPLNATKSYDQLCVRLTPAAASLAVEELNLKSAISPTLAAKLQKLLMLSSHHRLLLSKLVHLAPDLGLPPNFRSRLCNDHPDKFKTVDTSYGRALELVSWDPQLTVPSPQREINLGLIVDRPLKFKHLPLRKGLNLKRRHQDFLMKFQELPHVCPYNTSLQDIPKHSMEAEKRACAVVREVLGTMVERRTLVDHLTHFRKEFGFPNKLRAMIIRHPELFYLSLKGTRDAVFLVEAFDDNSVLLEKDKTSVVKQRLMELLSESKKMRKQRRKDAINKKKMGHSDDNGIDEVDSIDDGDSIDDEDDDGFQNLFEFEDLGIEYNFDHVNDKTSEQWDPMSGEFWTAESTSHLADHEGQCMEPW